MKMAIKMMQCLLVVILLMMMSCSSNRLMEYDFKDKTAAALMALPPPPAVFTDDWFFIDEDNLLETAIKIGTTIAKEVEVQKTQEKLGNAMEEVDVSERVRERTLKKCASYLRYEPVDDPDNADFLFDMHIQSYGIEAESWMASVHFKIDVKVFLIDNDKGIEVWKKRARVRLPITRGLFGLPDEAGDIITAVSLSKLTEEEMVEGFTHLSGYTADQVARKLQHDFAKARSKKK